MASVIEQKIESFLNEWRSDTPHIVAHTSGSTGAPNEIFLPKKVVELSARRTISFFRLNAGSRLHLCLSPDYIAGKMMIVRALLSGAQLTYESPSNSLLATAELQSGRRITLLAVVPSQLVELLNYPDRLACVDNILVGGGAMSQSLREQLANSGVSAYESYGMTETASHVALRKVTADDSVPFQMLPSLSCVLGPEGNLCIQTPDGNLQTRDAAEIISSKSFRLLGRLDHAIITGGVKVHPLQVEAAIEPIMNFILPGRKYYISSVPDVKWGSRVILVVEGELPDVRAQHKCLDAIKVILDGPQCPKQIVAVSQFEYTDTGKLRRNTFS